MSMLTAHRLLGLPPQDQVRVLVTVGTELPFDRLVRTVESWATTSGHTDEVLAQVGESGEIPGAIAWTRFLDGPRFREYFCGADLVIAHAGMGTILSALQFGRPLIVMPRMAKFGEHRNDHQLATARRLAELDRVDVAFDEDELVERLDDHDLAAREPIGPYADEQMISALRGAIRDSHDLV